MRCCAGSPDRFRDRRVQQASRRSGCCTDSRVAAHAGRRVPARRQTLRRRRGLRSVCRRADASALVVNRNVGSGTRVLMESLLDGARPPGYANQPKSHNAVAAAIAQGRADWGLAIEPVAKLYGLGFLPVSPEHYDFLVVDSRRERPGVQVFLTALRDDRVRARIRALGMEPDGT